MDIEKDKRDKIDRKDDKSYSTDCTENFADGFADVIILYHKTLILMYLAVKSSKLQRLLIAQGLNMLIVISLVLCGLAIFAAAVLFISQSRKTQNQNSELVKFSTQLDQVQKQHLELCKLLQDGLRDGMKDVRQQMQHTLQQHTNNLNQQFEKLNHTTENKLKEISGQVEKRLSDGFEKTQATFTNIVKRLAMIDAAQQKITELSGNVVSLQNILMDKRSRGAFGEVQLASLIRNVLPESNFSLQYTLPNSKRVDCMLFLPEPTGNIAVDAKFPLETYQIGRAHV